MFYLYDKHITYPPASVFHIKLQWHSHGGCRGVRHPKKLEGNIMPRSTQPSIPGVGKSSTSLLAGVKAGHVYLCRIAGNTVYPIWQVTSRSSEIRVPWRAVRSFNLPYSQYRDVHRVSKNCANLFFVRTLSNLYRLWNFCHRDSRVNKLVCGILIFHLT